MSYEFTQISQLTRVYKTDFGDLTISIGLEAKYHDNPPQEVEDIFSDELQRAIEARKTEVAE